MITVSTEILNRTNVYNTDKNQVLCEHKISILDWFPKDHVTEDFRKIQLCYQE